MALLSLTPKSGMVQTVLGPIDPEDLGVTLCHEHLLIDFVGDRSALSTRAGDRGRWMEPISLSNLYEARSNFELFRDSSQMLRPSDLIEAVGRFRLSGGDCIVEVTSGGLGRDPKGLQQISAASGVKVVMGAGYYYQDYHPPEVSALTESDIQEQLVREFAEGAEGSDIRPGIIGEIGLSFPMHPDERKVLRGAARAQTETGMALTIHPGRHPSAPLEAVRIVEEAGGDVARTVVGHMERTIFDVEGLVKLAESGCYVEFDTFGLESAYFPWAPIDHPNDAIRINYLAALMDRGHGNQLLISQDICTKVRLRAYGGEGYEHILENVLPIMERKGLGQEELAHLMVDNPRRLLPIA